MAYFDENRFTNVVTKTNCPSCGAPAIFNYTHPSDVCPYCYNTIPQFHSLIIKLREDKMKQELDFARQKQEYELNLARQRQEQEARLALEMQRKQQEHEASMTVIREEQRRENRSSFARATGSCCGTVVFKGIFGLLLGIGVIIALIVYLPQILEYAVRFKISFWEALFKTVAGK